MSFILVLLFATACVLRPAWQRLAAEGQLQRGTIETDRFRHLVLANGIEGDRLTIYVEGDGRPWVRETRVAIDPTPAEPVLLRLMHKVTHPAAYLGRPCYFGTATSGACDARFWTFARYGPEVIDSMCAAANRLRRESGAESVQLVGFSGGGALVLGMRQCTERLASIVTIAGNLDPDAWTRYHGYTPLELADIMFNAAESGAEVPETHWQCRDDRNIPPEITDAYFAARPAATRHIVGQCTHASGWSAHWAAIARRGVGE